MGYKTLWARYDLSYSETSDQHDTASYLTDVDGYSVEVYVPYADPYYLPDTPEEFIRTGRGPYFASSEIPYAGYLSGDAYIAVEVKATVSQVVETIPVDDKPTTVSLIRHDDYYAFQDANGYVHLPDPHDDPHFLVVEFYDHVWRAVNVEFPDLFTSKTDTRNLNTLDPTDFTFTFAGDAMAGNDVVTLPDTVAKWKEWGLGTADVFDAGRGDDIVTGGMLNDKIDGGIGNDTLIGGAGNDVLTADVGNDVIHGGTGDDVLVLAGTRDQFKFNFSKPIGQDGASGTVISKTQSAANQGTDTFDGIEWLQFDNEKVPLHQWSFVIDRGQDGNITKMAFLEDGVEVKNLSTANAKYDDATPINTNSAGYEAVFRENGTSVKGYPFCVELADIDKDGTTWSGTSSVKGRIAIQMHGGTTTQNSEGCFVWNGGYFPAVQAYMDKYFAELQGPETARVKDTNVVFDNLLIPLTVVVNGDVAQPKISMTAASAKEDVVLSSATVSDRRAGTYDIRLDMTGDGDIKGISKRVDIYFEAKSTKAVYGEDYTFGSGVSEVMNGKKHTGIFKTTFDSNNASDSIRVKILSDANNEKAETIDFKITDIDILRKKGADWVMHEDSADDKNHLNNPTSTEKLLIGNDHFSLTIAADSKAHAMVHDVSDFFM